MKLIKEIKKSERGTFSFCSDGIVYVCKWHDNPIVNIASNFTTQIPTETVKRRVKKKAEARLNQPKLTKQYNLGMGDVDVMNRLLGTYRPMIQGKKWYWPLITNAINVSVVAAWRIHCNAVVSPMIHPEFLREIAICLLISPMKERTKVTGGTLPSLPKDIQFDQINHYEITTTQRGCKFAGKIHGASAKNATFNYIQTKVQFVLICIMEIRNQWTFMSHVQQMWLFDF